MWSGRIVPLLNVPSGSGTVGHSQSNQPEDILLPLPEDLCFGTGIANGSTVHVSYQLNPPIVSTRRGVPFAGPLAHEAISNWIENYSEEIAGWIVISQFPIELLSTRIMYLVVRLTNQPGAFFKSVATAAAKNHAALFQIEGMSTGDESSLLLFAGSEDDAARRMIDLILMLARSDDDKFQSFTARVPARVKAEWKNIRRTTPEAELRKVKGVAKIGWLEQLVNPPAFDPQQVETASQLPSDLSGATVSRMKSKKASVSDRRIKIPWGDITRGYEHTSTWLREANVSQLRELENYEDRLYIPKYVLLVKEHDLPVIVAIIPRRTLFQIDMPITCSDALRTLNSVGIGEIQAICKLLDEMQINIWHIEQIPLDSSFVKRRDSSGLQAFDCSFLDSMLKIVAACPRDWPNSQEQQLLEFAKIKKLLCNMRISPNELLVKNPDQVVVKAPALLRVFFSHSASPANDERQYIESIKKVLQKFAVDIEEGEFAIGQSTNELSRGRIRLCSVLVSLFWPRDEFKTEDGKFMPPEWVVHEESYALGLGLGVIRVRESSVKQPRYEYDRPTIAFTQHDPEDWKSATALLEKELQEIVLG